VPRPRRGSRAAADLSLPPVSGFLAARASVPAPPAGMVARPSLRGQLDRATQRRLTVVSAGPGWGKTSTLADWASTQSAVTGVAWLSLVRSDDSLSGFWSALLHALRRSGRIPGENVLSRLSPTHAMTERMLQTAYEGIQALPSALVLVLDDFHVIQDAEVLDSVARLLSHDLPLHLVLVTRSDTVLPLHRLRLSGQLSEIVADDLAFGQTELAALALNVGLDLDLGSVERVLDRTGGWPAGARMATLHLSRPGTARDLSDFAGSDRSVAEYLMAEVMNAQNPSGREFLLRTSVVGAVCAELANTLVPRARGQQRLEQLARSNQFVTELGPEQRWYRYHPLLREMLEHLLRRDEPAEFELAHARAARWLAWNGEPVAALQHAASAQDWTLLSEIFVQSTFPEVVGPHRQVIADVLERIPFDHLEPTAPLAICGWALTYLQGNLSAMAAQVELARALLQATQNEVRPATAAAIEFNAFSVARARGDSLAMQTAARAAQAQLDQVVRPFPALPALRAVAAHSLAIGLLWAGETDDACALFATTGPEAQAVGVFQTALDSLSHQSLSELVEGRLDEAELAAGHALRMADPQGVLWRYQVRPAHLTQGYVKLLHGDTEGADRCVLAGLAATEGATEPGPTVMAYICQSLVAVSRGRGRAAHHASVAARGAAEGWPVPNFLDDWLTRATVETVLLNRVPDELAQRIDALRTQPRPSATVLACLSRLQLAAGDAPGAQAIAHRVCASSEAGEDVDHLALVDAWLVRALAADHLGHDHESAQRLHRALDLAGPARLLRPFLVANSERLPILIRRQLDFSPRPSPFVLELASLLASGEPALPEPEPLQFPLTERELTVLAFLPTMETNTEIAQQLFVSVNTVKAHLKSLYRKLGVGDRRDAIRRSRALGLLP